MPAGFCGLVPGKIDVSRGQLPVGKCIIRRGNGEGEAVQRNYRSHRLAIRTAFILSFDVVVVKASYPGSPSFRSVRIVVAAARMMASHGRHPHWIDAIIAISRPSQTKPTTGRREAVRRATVGVDVITIIAFLHTLLGFSITATCGCNV